MEEPEGAAYKVNANLQGSWLTMAAYLLPGRLQWGRCFTYSLLLRLHRPPTDLAGIVEDKVTAFVIVKPLLVQQSLH